MFGDSRTIVLKVLKDGRDVINGDPSLSDADAVSKLSEVFSTRWERVLRITAEDGVEYGRVVGVIAEIRAAVDGINIMIMREDNGPLYLHDCFAGTARYSVHP